MTKPSKLIWLLILQAWTMLWVIIGHAQLDKPTSDGINMVSHTIAQSLVNFAYSFHMPLFIMISGFLFYRTRIAKGWKYNDMVKEKWIRLGIPYIFFITLSIIIKLCFPGDMNRPVDSTLTGIIMNYIDPYDSALREMWFVAVIFIYFLIYPVYNYLLKNEVTTIITALISIVIFFIPQTLIPKFFAINRAVHFFVFFFIGLSISRWNLENQIEDWKIIVTCTCGYLISYYFMLPILTPIFASFGFWGLAMKIDISLTSNIFHSFRNYTYQIFLIGIFVQIFVKILARLYVFPGSYAIWWLVCVVLGIYIPVLLAKIPIVKDKKFYKILIGI